MPINCLLCLHPSNHFVLFNLSTGLTWLSCSLCTGLPSIKTLLSFLTVLYCPGLWQCSPPTILPLTPLYVCEDMHQQTRKVHETTLLKKASLKVTTNMTFYSSFMRMALATSAPLSLHDGPEWRILQKFLDSHSFFWLIDKHFRHARLHILLLVRSGQNTQFSQQ